MPDKFKIVFFGTPDFAVAVLNELERGGLIPDLIVTNPDEPKGRKLIITPPPVKTWAIERNIKFIQPDNLKSIPRELEDSFDIFIVAAYGKIIPEEIINIPKHGTINIHPSLLPKYRGPSPVQSAILNGDTETGVTIMLLDKEMDHGPIITQESVTLSDKETLPELKGNLARIGARLIISVLPEWITGRIKAIPQEHEEATYTKKIESKDGFIESRYILNSDINDEKAKEIERKIRALHPDPGVYTLLERAGGNMRIKITEAELKDGLLVLKKVIPEGKREMAWEDFMRGYKITSTLQ